MNYVYLRQEIIDKKRDLDSLQDYKTDFFQYADLALHERKVDLKQLQAYIQLCIDYYAMSSNGDNLIPDILYDKVVERYKAETGSVIIYADPIIETTHWKMIPHKIPGMVGSIKKIYSYEEFRTYLRAYEGVTQFKLSVKLDGVSVCIEKRNGRILSAATRYDGEQGQDITALVKDAVMYGDFLKKGPDGFYKCEMLVTTEQYNELIQYKKYANRRSATSGIINTPANIKYAKYITVVPLLYYDDYHHEKEYIMPFIKTVTNYSSRDMMDEIEHMLEKYRSSSFPFRMDGVVITPVIAEAPNEGDMMESSIAYKVNTNEALSRIIRGYMSVGRLGKAVPMVEVEPVEVNEVVVSDVSLGSYAKYKSMGLREHEEIVVYSAGDVIPQAKLPLIRTNYSNDDDLKIAKVCPYCDERLTKIGNEYYCTNEDCIRVITGRITNFLVKLEFTGFADKSIEVLYRAGVLSSIQDLFSITQKQIEEVPGFDTVSATDFMEQVNLLKTKQFNVSDVFGALGIDDISVKKCRKIFSEISLDDLLHYIEKEKYHKINERILGGDGIGQCTANTFTDFVEQNRDLVQFVCKNMKILGDLQWRGNVVFTGFRNSMWAEKFQAIGYEVATSVNSKTQCVIAAADAKNTGNALKATSKGIPVFSYREIGDVLEDLKHYIANPEWGSLKERYGN